MARLPRDRVGTSGIEVFLRERPLADGDAEERRCLTIVSDTNVKLDTTDISRPLGGNFDGGRRQRSQPDYQFRRVFSDQASQEDVYAAVGKEVVDQALQPSGGKDGCLIAYGQTGSGKTYSMRGKSVISVRGDEGRGIIPRHVF